MDIIKIENENNRRYEELIVKKDELLSEANSIYINYKILFGDEEIKIYTEEVECIKCKKIVSYLQNLINHEKIFDIEILNAEISKQMLAYRDELANRIEELKSCKESQTVSLYDTMEVKKIYRKLVKILHPDINPMVAENDDLIKLWMDISNAYKMSNLKRMQELEVLANKIIKDNGFTMDLYYNIDNIEEKINELEEEIAIILKSEPYIYKEILHDDDKISELHRHNTQELEKYINYKNELKIQIEELKKKVL